MKNLLALLVMVSIVELSLAQSILNENNISGIWLTGDEKTVLLYQAGNVYNMVGYDLGQRQTMGDILAQYIPLGKSCFQIVGMMESRKGSLKAIDAFGRFDGRSEIKVKGESYLNLSLVRMLSNQELLAATHSQIQTDYQTVALSTGSGIQSSGYEVAQGTSIQEYPIQRTGGTVRLPGPEMAIQQTPVLVTQPGQQAIRSPLAPSPSIAGLNYHQPYYPQPEQSITASQQIPEAPQKKKEKGKKLLKGLKTAAKIAGGLGVINLGKLIN